MKNSIKFTCCFRSLTFIRCIVFCSLINYAVYENISFAASTSTELTMRIAYIANKGEFNESYDAQNYLKELFSILAKYTPLQPTFIPYSVSEYISLSTAQTKNDILAFAGKSADRLYSLKYSKEPAAHTKILLVTNKNENIMYDDIQAMNGKSVAIYTKNNFAINLLDDYIVKNNITMKYQLYPNYNEYLKSDADYHLINSFYYIRDKQLAATLGEQDLFFAAAPKNAPMLDALDAAIKQARIHDIAQMQKLDRIYVDKTSEGLGYTEGSERQQMLDKPRKHAEVLFSKDHFPIQYVNEQNIPSGITINILDFFKQIHKNPTTLIPYGADDTKDFQKFDMLFSVVGNKDIKEQFFYASKPYAYLSMVLFERKKTSHTEKKPQYGMLDYSVLDHAQVRAHFPYWDMHIFPDITSMLTAYKEKKIQSMLFSNPEAEYAISQLGLFGNKITFTALELPLCFYLSKTYPPQALSVLNGFVDKLTPAVVRGAVIDAENALRAPSTAQEFFVEYKTPLIIAVVVSILFLIMLYILKVRADKNTLKKIINTDPLTGLGTKSYAYNLMQRTLKKALPDEYMIICLDIDKFSLLNQVYGSEKADEVLRLMAATIKEQYPIKEKNECIAHLRDDVFLIFMKAKQWDGEYVPFDCKLNFTYGVKEILQSDYNISLSLGVYLIDDITLPVETIIDYCNAARYKCKHEHGISITLFTESMKNKIDAEKRIIYRMEKALESDEFILHFQPKVELNSTHICGAEVLVRWQPQNAPAIYPDDFISVFENNAFIAHLDMYVFEKACHFIHTHRNRISLPPLAVNLSGISILHDTTYGNIQRILQQYSIHPQEIEIEITESALVAESLDFLKAIDSIRALGFSIAIDDFGTGVSSLHRLSSLRVDVVKLDKAFLDDKLTTKKGILLVASMISMLHRLDMKVIAEGVETERHVHMLKKMHCDIAQGYYFYKPLPENDFLRTLMHMNTKQI